MGESTAILIMLGATVAGIAFLAWIIPEAINNGAGNLTDADRMSSPWGDVVSRPDAKQPRAD